MQVANLKKLNVFALVDRCFGVSENEGLSTVWKEQIATATFNWWMETVCYIYLLDGDLLWTMGSMSGCKTCAAISKIGFVPRHS